MQQGKALQSGCVSKSHDEIVMNALTEAFVWAGDLLEGDLVEARPRTLYHRNAILGHDLPVCRTNGLCAFRPA